MRPISRSTTSRARSRSIRNSPDAYLERGTLMAMKGDYDGAHGDWNRVKELAPGTFVAELAQKNLAKLDALIAKAAKSPKPAQP